jgi:hypothetical protein
MTNKYHLTVMEKKDPIKIFAIADEIIHKFYFSSSINSFRYRLI